MVDILHRVTVGPTNRSSTLITFNPFWSAFILIDGRV